jgi:hypothetical protein
MLDDYITICDRYNHCNYLHKLGYIYIYDLLVDDYSHRHLMLSIGGF